MNGPDHFDTGDDHQKMRGWFGSLLIATGANFLNSLNQTVQANQMGNPYLQRQQLPMIALGALALILILKK